MKNNESELISAEERFARRVAEIDLEGLEGDTALTDHAYYRLWQYGGIVQERVGVDVELVQSTDSGEQGQVIMFPGMYAND